MRRDLRRLTGWSSRKSARPGALLGHQGVADKRLHVPAKRLQEWLRQGKLAAWKASGQWRVDAKRVAALDASDQLRGRSRRLDPRFHG